MRRRSGFGRGEWTLVVGGIVAFLVLSAFHYGKATAFARPAFAARSFAADLDARYGPGRHSEDLEEWLIRDFFQDERGGVFVDVGANHHQERSNTYYLETALGWSGVAIEPQTQFAAGYQEYRPKTVFVPLFVSDTSNATAILHVPKHNHLVASVSREFAEQWDRDITPTETTTTTLDDALDRLGVTRVDFLSMDIELNEPKALAGFSIDRFRPRLVCIEAHAGVRQSILNYFHQHGYVLIGHYLPVDTDNYWFAPLGSAPPEHATGHAH